MFTEEQRAEVSGILSGMTINELDEISREINNHRKRQEALLALRWHVGDRVQFSRPSTKDMLRGIITKLNQRTASVTVNGMMRWNVGYEFLEKAS